MPFITMRNLQSLIRTPGYSFAAVLILALGIGANTAILGVFDAVLLRPLPVPEPERLVRLAGDHSQSFVYFSYGKTYVAPSVARIRGFAGVSAHTTGEVTLGTTAFRRLRAAAVNAEFFDVLRVKPYRGRAFTREEERDLIRVAVIGHELWRSAYAGASDVLSRTITLGGREFQIVGVMPDDFTLPEATEVWLPTGARIQTDSAILSPIVIARFAPGASPAQVLEEVRRAPSTRFAAGAVVDNPAHLMGARNPRFVPLQYALAGDVVPVLFVVVAGAVLVLLVASANTAGLWFTRIASRQHDFAVRRALGATDGDLRRQIGVEAALLLGIAGVASLPVALWTLELVRTKVPMLMPSHGPGMLSMDGRIVVAAFICTLAAGAMFTVGPLLWVRKGASASSLRGASLASTGDPGWRRARGALVVGQVACAVVLMLGAVTVFRTVSALLAVNLGAHGEKTLVVQVDVPGERERNPSTSRQTIEAVQEALRALPAVQDVAVGTAVPGSGGVRRQAELIVDGKPVPSGYVGQSVWVTPSYFSTLGITLLAGRAFTQSDHFFAPKVAIVSQTYARRYNMRPNEMVGRTAVLNHRWVQIVGVVSDVRLGGPEADLDAAAYIPFAQTQMPSRMQIVVRSAQDPLVLVPSVRTAVARIAPHIALYNIRSFDQVREEYVRDRRFVMNMMTAFGILAVGLAALGLYAAVGYAVHLRTREIGIRIAMGASRRAVCLGVLRDGLAHAALGVVVGSCVATAASWAFSSHMQRFGEFDLASLSLVSVSLLLVAAAAAWFPAARAARIDPVQALRFE